jgi:hypothetical protein
MKDFKDLWKNKVTKKKGKRPRLTSLPSFSPYFHLPKNINFKTFLTFYIKSIIFFHYLNKKTNYNTNFFSFFYINYFYFISHQLLFTFAQQKNYFHKRRGLLNETKVTLAFIRPTHKSYCLSVSFSTVQAKHRTRRSSGL